MLIGFCSIEMSTICYPLADRDVMQCSKQVHSAICVNTNYYFTMIED